MAWLIAGLFVLLLIGGLIGFARVREHDRQPTDDTLVAELLGQDVPPPPDDTDVLPAARLQEDTQVLPVARPPRAAEARPTPDTSARPDSPASPAPAETRAPEPAETRAPAPAPGAAAEDADWLESQLAWIRNWSQRMRDQLGPGGGEEPDREG